MVSIVFVLMRVDHKERGQMNWCFELWLETSWESLGTARRSANTKEINSPMSLKETEQFNSKNTIITMARTDSEKTWCYETWEREGRGRQRIRWYITDPTMEVAYEPRSYGSSREAWMAKVQEMQRWHNESDWTELSWICFLGHAAIFLW